MQSGTERGPPEGQPPPHHPAGRDSGPAAAPSARLRRTDYKRELDRLRALRLSGYPELVAEIVLVLACVTVGALAYQLWWLFGWYAVHYSLVFVERRLLRTRPDRNSAGFFALVLGLNVLIGSNFALLSVLLWHVDHLVYKFAVIALLAGSTLNTFLVRTRVWQSMLCFVIPNCAAVILIAASFSGEGYALRDTITAFVVAAALIGYLLISVLQAYRWHDAYEKTRQTLELARRSEAIGRLTGGIAHDFNNLLFVILGNLEALRETTRTGPERALIDAGIRAAERGADLTANMLRFARQANLTPRLVDLNALVRDLIRFAARTLPDNIVIETRLAEDLCLIEVDESSTESALLNLLLNARDAMAPDGGRILITTANTRIRKPLPVPGDGVLVPGRYVSVSIADTGHGIARKDLAHIFEPFATTKPTGTGLGLTMVDLFMKTSGGAIRVDSDPGKGATFQLYFRALSKPVPKPTAPEIEAGAEPRPGARLLVVEDEPVVRETLLRMLDRSGHEIVSANSGDAALRLFQSDPAFDLVITDVVMPGALQGPALAERLRRIRPDLPVLFLSGHDFGAIAGHPGVRDTDPRLCKPVNRERLAAAIATALAQGAGR